MAHRLVGYAWLAARRAEPPLAEALQPLRARISARELAAERWRGELLDWLIAAGAQPIAFKGLGVAHTVYPAADLRPLGDVDLLFEPEGARCAVSALSAHGFASHRDPMVQRYFWLHGYNVPLEHPERGLVEVHHAAYPDCPEGFLDDALTRLGTARVLGRDVRALHDVDLFLLLAVHFTISKPGSVWVWLLDLWLLGQRFDEAAWAGLARTAQRHGLQAFAVFVFDALDAVWSARPPAPGQAVLRRLRGQLTALESRAVSRLVARLGRGEVSGDPLRVARRLSGRPSRHRPGGALAEVWPHAGAVCYELGVAYAADTFWRHRIRHVVRRLRRVLGAMGP